MAKNVTLMGASYPDVPAVNLPQTGGGTARFTDTSGTTATASDVAQGKVFYAADGTETTGTASGGSATIEPLSVTANGTYNPPSGVDGYSPVVVNVPTGGGGGASNLVAGTFKGTTTGSVLNINIPYTGSGYPILFSVYPTEGPYNSEEGTFYSLIQRYGCAYYRGIKSQINTIPSYDGTNGGNVSQNAYSVVMRYKSSTTSSAAYQVSAVNEAYVAKDTDPIAHNTSSTYTILKFRSNNVMSVIIASTSFGFIANIEYTYWVIYSS